MSKSSKPKQNDEKSAKLNSWIDEYKTKVENFDFGVVSNVANLTDSYLEYRIIEWVGHSCGSNYYKDDDVPAVIHALMEQIDCINSLGWKDDLIDDYNLETIKIPAEVAWLIQPMFVRWQTTNTACSDLTLKADRPNGVKFSTKVMSDCVDKLYKWFRRTNTRLPDVKLIDVRKALSIENVLDFYIGPGFKMVMHPCLNKLPINVGNTIVDMFTENQYVGNYKEFLDQAFSSHDIGKLFGVQELKQ